MLSSCVFDDICLCVCMYVYICVCVHMYMYVYIYTYTHISSRVLVLPTRALTVAFSGSKSTCRFNNSIYNRPGRRGQSSAPTVLIP